MEIEEAFRHALDGDAILFLGAGFSLGAINKFDKEFPLANDLSKHLMADLGETEDAPLEASTIVNRQMNERRHAYYPFRVARRYLALLHVTGHLNSATFFWEHAVRY